MKKEFEYFQICLEDRLLLLLEEAGGFFLIVSIIAQDQKWIFLPSLIISLVLWVIGAVYCIGLLKKRYSPHKEGFPKFILVWQTLFLIAYRLVEGAFQAKTLFFWIMLGLTLLIFVSKLRSAIKS